MLFAAGCTKKTVAKSTPPAPTQSTPAEQPRQQTTPAARPTPPPQQQASTTPPQRTMDAATRARIDQLLARIEDAYFDYNQHTLRPDAIKALQADSTELRDIIVQYPNYHLTIEGHADERGSEEYNLALGDARAKAAKAYLTQVGIPDAQLAVISYGKDKPVCDEHDEACWQKNRRIHIVAVQAQ
jgi:peptidoglycan-associated lipoprotein